MGVILAFLPPGGVPGGYLEDIAGRAALSGSSVTAVYVLDSVWSRFSSADWLSTGPSRAEFDRYMRETLLAEGKAMADGLRLLAEKAGVSFRYEVVKGDPADAIASSARAAGAHEVIVPHGHDLAGCAPDVKRKLVIRGKP